MQEAVVAVREDESGEQRLIGYVVPRDNSGLTVPEIRKFCRRDCRLDDSGSRDLGDSTAPDGSRQDRPTGVAGA